MKPTLHLFKIPLVMLAATGIVIAQERPSPNALPRREPPGMRLPEGVRALRDIEYVNGGGQAQSLDLFLPEKSEGSLPIIVWIHGGGWRAGDKRGGPALPFTTRGYAVASLNYRLTPKAIFPSQIEDCKAALRWLRAHAKEHNLNPDRIGVWGSSAGGHLVALLGTSGGVKDLEGNSGNPDQSSRVQAVCDWFGPTDFAQMEAHALNPGKPFNHDGADSPESVLVGGPIQENKDKVRRANPLTYVTADDPPFLIMHGDKDPLVPHHQSELLEAALKKAGVEVTFQTIKGAGHGGPGFQDPQATKTIEEFFDKHLKKK